MFVHLRVFSMFVLAFVLIVMASSIDDIGFNRSGDPFQIKSRGVGSDNVRMLFEIAAKVNVSGLFRKPNALWRNAPHDENVAARGQDKADELKLDSALQAAIKRETSSGVGLFTFIGHENYGNAAAYSDPDNANFAVKPAIAMKSVDEFELSGADADVFVVYGPVQGVDGALLNVLGQQFDLSAIDTRDLDFSAVVGRSAYLEGHQAGDMFGVTRIELFEEYSVPGASPILVVGKVTEVNSEIGRLQIGSLEVDTTIMGTEVRFESGREVSITGTQPVPGGLILGQQGLVVDANLIGALGSSKVVSIIGDSVWGISGSSRSLRGISGSSVRGISGSSRSLRGISGSSVRGISGSSRSLRGISGSSVRGISGSSRSLRGISGSSSR